MLSFDLVFDDLKYILEALMSGMSNLVLVIGHEITINRFFVNTFHKNKFNK